MQLRQVPQYLYLMRLHRPIGIFLLLWPTLWALWLAAGTWPDAKILFIFITGVVLMRSLGCMVNDFIDRDIDPAVQRTKDRPLASGRVSSMEALSLILILALSALLLVSLCNRFTIILAFIGAALTVVYPFLKRVTHMPQLGLGLAFSWGVPMAFAAQEMPLTYSMWLFFLTCMIWPMIYDTIYAMSDRADDLQIGVKSTAILFDRYDRVLIGMLQIVFLFMLMLTGLLFKLRASFFSSLIGVALLFIYQQWLIKDRDPERCLLAFNNNNWVGFVVFLGIVTSLLS